METGESEREKVEKLHEKIVHEVHPPLQESSKIYNLSPFTANTPAIKSLCPAMNFVAECITMSGRKDN